ncbi:hypothetical protein BGX33_000285 [Mortierella sp. NVP41]|nr:hypothetical protein BGX33_000285 [Mortierella sp. NVP41]
MTSQRSQHGTKRPVQNTRFAELQSPQLRAQNPTTTPTPASQHHSESDDLSEEDDFEHEADETVCYSQRPFLQDEKAPVLSPARDQSSVPVRSSVPAPSSGDASAAPEAWWTSLQQEQLVAYTQQQQELFAEAGQVNEKLFVCTSPQEHERLMMVMQNLAQREQELRYMLEARQAWDSYARMYEQRLTYLASRAQSHP